MFKRRKKGEYCDVTVKEELVESDLTGSVEKLVETNLEHAVFTAARVSGLIPESSVKSYVDTIMTVLKKEIKTRLITGLKNEILKQKSDMIICCSN